MIFSLFCPQFSFSDLFLMGSYYSLDGSHVFLPSDMSLNSCSLQQQRFVLSECCWFVWLFVVLIDSFQQDDSTRQSQDSNYSDEAGMSVSALGRGSEQQDLVANDDSNMSFPPMSDNARQSVQDSDADPDMRLGPLPLFCQLLKVFRHIF